MKNFLGPLLDLHVLDSERIHLEKQLAQIPSDLARLEGKVNAQNDLLSAKKTQMKELDKRRQELEHALYAQEGLRDRCKTQQPLVKKQDEYEALGKQMEEAVSKIDELENNILAALEQSDGLKAEFAQLQRVTSAQIADIQKEMEQVQASKTALQAAHLAKVAACEALAKTIPQGPLHTYQVAQSRAKAPPFIVTISEGRCQGCYIKLSGEILGKVKSKEELVPCDQCGRLLVEVSLMNEHTG